MHDGKSSLISSVRGCICNAIKLQQELKDYKTLFPLTSAFVRLHTVEAQNDLQVNFT